MESLQTGTSIECISMPCDQKKKREEKNSLHTLPFCESSEDSEMLKDL